MANFPKSFAALALLAVVLASPSCQCSKQKKSADDDVGSTATETIATVSASGAGSPTVPLTRSAVVRLTPEQMSNQLFATFGFRLGYTDDDGVFHDQLVEDFGVSLGGIDYKVADVRDPAARVQTLLITRMLAVEITNRICSDVENAVENRFMALASLTEDRPFHSSDAAKTEAEKAAIRAGEVRWRAQIVEFYERLFARQPSDRELALIRKAFLDAYVKNDRLTPMAWRATIFALVSTLELWSL